MSLQFIHNWTFFLICFADMLITSAIMSALAKSFFTMGTSRKSFSTFDLEFPSTTVSTNNLLRGIDKMPGESAKIKRALRAQLYVDFLFMPGTYLGVLFLCLKVAEKSGNIGDQIFSAIAYLQLLCWLCDIIENIFLLSFMNNPADYSQSGFKAWNIMEIVKWGGSLTGFFSSSFALLYFWITANYHKDAIWTLLLIVIETILITVIMKNILGKKRSAAKS